MLTLILRLLFYKKLEQCAEKTFLIYGEERNNKKDIMFLEVLFNALNAELNPIRHLLALVGARHIAHVGRIRVNEALISKFIYCW